jgi:hypothetical protein
MHSRKQWGICFGRTRACRVERVLGLDGMGIRIALFFLGVGKHGSVVNGYVFKRKCVC